MITLVYTDDGMYYRTKTIMSSIYEIVGKDYCRCDWGKVQIMLKQGHEIKIRQSTPKEKIMFQELEEKLKESLL